MATVYEDAHGPYVKAGGWLFRPVFPVGYKHVFPAGTSFNSESSLSQKKNKANIFFLERL